MKCPNCGWNMDNKSFNYYAPIADWDMDYPPRLHEAYFCKVCGMKYLNGEWKIPQEFEPTDKQVNTVMFIERATKFEAPYPLTRRVAREYISRYFELAKRMKGYVISNACPLRHEIMVKGKKYLVITFYFDWTQTYDTRILDYCADGKLNINELYSKCTYSEFDAFNAHYECVSRVENNEKFWEA